MLENGSWNTNWIRLREGLSARCVMAARSIPPYEMLPASGVSSRTMLLPKVVLPQPDSPTSAMVSPRFNSNETPSTARTYPTVRLKNPFRIGKYVFRSRI